MDLIRMISTNLIHVLVFIFSIIIIFRSTHAQAQPAGLPKIAVVGGGIGGSSVAYFLKESFGQDVSIDVYEKGDIGGRLATVEFGGKQFESGGSIIHPKNMYMVNFTKLLGLEQQQESGRFGLYDGTEMLFTSSPWQFVTLGQLFWRYGWQLMKLNNYIHKMLTNFNRIYAHQNKGLAFTKVEKLLQSMDDELMAYLHYSMDEVLAHEGFSQKFIQELVMAATKNNYGQTPDMQAFVASVSLAGVESGLWSVKGGNKEIPIRLLEYTKVNLIMSKVNKITLKETDNRKQYEIATDHSSKVYDIVVVATPLHDDISEISFVNFPKEINNFSRSYHRTVATFVRGLPNFIKFGYKTIHEIPENILVVNDKLFFNSVGKLHDVYKYSSYKEKQELPTWKIFSQSPLTDKELNQLFISYEDIKIVDWKSAYPHYSTSEVNLPPFTLYDGLYYINTMEIAASCMEMEAIGAKNVALLAYYYWNREDELVDYHVYGEFGHSEL